MKKECIVPLYLSKCNLGHSSYVTFYLSVKESYKGMEKHKHSDDRSWSCTTDQCLLATISHFTWENVFIAS